MLYCIHSNLWVHHSSPFLTFDQTVNAILHTPLPYLPGIGTQRAELLAAELGIRSVEDLITHYPFRYIDRSEMLTIGLLKETVDAVQIRGILGPIREEGTGTAKRLKSTLKDATGSIELIWFKGQKWILQNLVPGSEYIAFGKVANYKGHLNMAHPELEKPTPDGADEGYLQPVYSTTEKLTRRGMSSKGLERIIGQVIVQAWSEIPESLPEPLRQELKLIAKGPAMYAIHRPKSLEDVKQARRRLKFEELFFIQLELLLKKELRNKDVKGFVFEAVSDAFLTFYEKHLPFELTGAQKRVLKEIRRDMRLGIQMNRLLQGDVGSGKTMVAALSALIAIDNGFQVSIMAPTEILATQHFETFSGLFAEMPIRVELLTGSTKTAKRRAIDAALQSGELHVLIGTHALIEDRVKFKNLGLAVIDEQHRFGVAQRAKLWKKNTLPPHVLVMTATPIPRTLAMTLYGDLDVSVIDELPPGRKAVQTSHVFDNARLKIFNFMEDQIKRGRQVYVVYPLIEESATLDLKDLMDGYESVSRRFPVPNYQISIVHGRMKSADKEWEMNRFVRGETQIMVATTVIEVGVNVPNASIMVIESAQRFGLSQLHQLRGRVGRGADQSYCILVSDQKLSKEARLRLKTMTETNDGFKIAEVDLKLRGPGDLMGTQQSGLLDLKLANLATDSLVLQYARNAVIDMLEEDPELVLPKNAPVANRAKEIIRNKPNWSRIS
jgi:ATP-dependent DNA helicase RecG